jgi:hypothetical protein
MAQNKVAQEMKALLRVYMHRVCVLLCQNSFVVSVVRLQLGQLS